MSVCVLQAILCLTDLICNTLQLLSRSAHNHNIQPSACKLQRILKINTSILTFPFCRTLILSYIQVLIQKSLYIPQWHSLSQCLQMLQ